MIFLHQLELVNYHIRVTFQFCFSQTSRISMRIRQLHLLRTNRFLLPSQPFCEIIFEDRETKRNVSFAPRIVRLLIA